MKSQEFHYYAATGYGWSVGLTRDEAVKAVAKLSGSRAIKAAKSCGGLFTITCRVPLEKAAHYLIEEYLPSTITSEDGVNNLRAGERIILSEIERVRITTTTGKTTPAA